MKITGNVIIKRINIWLIVLAVLAAIITVPMHTQAASKNLKSSGVSFTLKKNKSAKIKRYYRVIGKKTDTVKISNYKITNAGKKGYKKLTCTITFTPYSGWTKKQVYKCMHSDTYTDAGLAGPQ